MGRTTDDRPRQRQPRFWLIVFVAGGIVGTGYEALAAGDGSFDLDRAARVALIGMVASLVTSWGRRDGNGS